MKTAVRPPILLKIRENMSFNSARANIYRISRIDGCLLDNNEPVAYRYAAAIYYLKDT